MAIDRQNIQIAALKLLFAGNTGNISAVLLGATRGAEMTHFTLKPLLSGHILTLKLSPCAEPVCPVKICERLFLIAQRAEILKLIISFLR